MNSTMKNGAQFYDKAHKIKINFLDRPSNSGYFKPITVAIIIN